MNKFQYKMTQFMMGRRGFDQFSRDLMILALILILVLIFILIAHPWLPPFFLAAMPLH